MIKMGERRRGSTRHKGKERACKRAGKGAISMAKVISCTNLKGGTGKSLLSYSIGSIVAETGIPGKKEKDVKVLLMDMDMQENLTSNVGIQVQYFMRTTFDIFKQSINPDVVVEPKDIIIKGPIPGLPNLDLMPGSMTLHRVDTKIASEPARETILARYMEKYKAQFDDYDYIFIDTNPSMSILNQNCYLATDSIVLVAGTSRSSIDGMELFIALWNDIRAKIGINPDDKNAKGRIEGFIVNNFDRRTGLAKDFIEFIKSSNPELAGLMFSTIIPTNVRLAETETALPINFHDRNATSYKALLQLIEEMTERGIF